MKSAMQLPLGERQLASATAVCSAWAMVPRLTPVRREAVRKTSALVRFANNRHTLIVREPSAITQLNAQATAFNLLSASGLVQSKRLRIASSTSASASLDSRASASAACARNSIAVS